MFDRVLNTPLTNPIGCIAYIHGHLLTHLFTPILYPLKTSEKREVSDVLRGYRKSALGTYELITDIHRCNCLLNMGFTGYLL